MFSNVNHTVRHLLYANLWLLIFTLCAVLLISATSPHWEFGRKNFFAEVASIAWGVGFVGIFFSWARVDALEHGKSVKSAFFFAGLWLFFNFIAHIAYLFFTRGFRDGSLASIKFVCFLMSTGVVWFAFSRLVGAIV